MKKLRKRLQVMVVSTILMMQTCPAAAQVYINGELIEGLQLQALQLAIGEVIPAGHYWLDASGNWGYAGNSAIQGNLNQDYGSSDSTGGGKSHASYYSQGGAGGYGSYASDGDCSIISIEGMSMTSGNC